MFIKLCRQNYRKRYFWKSQAR